MYLYQNNPLPISHYEARRKLDLLVNGFFAEHPDIKDIHITVFKTCCKNLFIVREVNLDPKDEKERNRKAYPNSRGLAVQLEIALKHHSKDLQTLCVGYLEHIAGREIFRDTEFINLGWSNPANKKNHDE